MMALPTFACFDVMEDPEISQDFERPDAHLNDAFGGSGFIE